MKKMLFLFSITLLCCLSCGKTEKKLEIPKANNVTSQNAPVEMMSLGEGSSRDARELKSSLSDMNAYTDKSEFKSESKQAVSERKPIADRKLIKEASLKFQTYDVNKTKELIVNSVKTFSGYIANEKELKNPFNVSQSINIRVPSEKFEELIASISKGVDKFDEKNIVVKDVTADYIDIEARIKTKKEIEQQYLALLSKARSVKDMLEIEESLGIIREDIESMEGRFRYMSRQIEYSDIHIDFYQEIVNVSKSENRFVQGLISGWDGLVSFFIGLIYIWPLMIVIIFAIFVFIKMIRKRKTNKITDSEIQNHID